MNNYASRVCQQAKLYCQDARQMRKLCFYAFEFVLFMQLPLITFVAVCISYLAGTQFVKLRIQDFKQNGYISILPQKYQQWLSERSIFDIICDIWFIPKLSLYIRTFIKPFLQQVNPEDAYSILQDLPETDRQIICQKGGIKQLLQQDFTQLSTGDSYHRESDHSSQLLEEKQYPEKSINIIQRKQKKKRSKTLSINSEQPRQQQGFSMPWSIIKSGQLRRTESFASQSDQSDVPQFQDIDIVVNQVEVQEPPKPQWDKITTYQKFIRNLHSQTPLESIHRIASLVSNLVHFQQRSKQVLAIDNSKLAKVFIGSTAILVAQSIISKRARKFMAQSMIIVLYLGSAGVSTVALTLFVIKIINAKKHNRQ